MAVLNNLYLKKEKSNLIGSWLKRPGLFHKSYGTLKAVGLFSDLGDEFCLLCSKLEADGHLQAVNAIDQGFSNILQSGSP